VLLYAERLRELPTGWSADGECRLHEVEKLWLDPLRAQRDEEFRLQRLRGDWPAQVCHRFGNWLSSVLSTKQLAFGDAEHAHWSRALSKELSMFREILEDNRD
jgi:CRISPR-associated protein Csy1